METVVSKRRKIDQGDKDPLIRAQAFAGDEKADESHSEDDAAAIEKIRSRYGRPTRNEIEEMARRLARSSRR